ncbi:MAG: molybdate ABC transporter substrate-binding protein [Rubripirellula sp.]
MNRILIFLVGSIVALVAMGFMLVRNQPKVDSSGNVTLFCAASNRAVMEQIRSSYRKEFGREVEVQYGASQTLLSQIEISGAGDLFLPADDSYIKMAIEKGIVSEVLPIARMQAVIAVKKGNPKSIQNFQDLLKPEIRLVQANDAAAIGKLTRLTMQKAGLWDDLNKATVAERTTVTEAANDVLIGAADAAIVYDAVLHTYPDLEFIEIPELKPAASLVAVGVSSSTKSSAAALHFARYLAASDRGLEVYRDHGFRVSGGDKWSDVPKLRLFAGSMLRPAIEETIADFQEREGVQVDTVYNGCGILVAQMKAGQVPDAYFACDKEFMEQVPDLFPEPTDVSENELVILVEKGNPHNLSTLRDLTKEGLRVGVGHEKQCAMGWLTQNTFREGGIQQEVMENVTVQSPTGDMLVNQMRTGSLDAAVVYLSNAVGSGDILDAVRIQGLECSIATQPYAVAPESPHAQTASRLFQQICSADSQSDFAKEGFRWKLASDADATLTEDKDGTDD